MGEKPKWEGHRERLRQTAIVEGFSALRETQVMELLLSYAVPRVDLAQVSKALIDRFGAATRAVGATRDELMSVPGMSPAMTDWLMMTGELLRAYAQADPLSPQRIWRFMDLARYLGASWRDVQPPQCHMLYTDFEGRVLMESELCRSLNWADPQYAAEIVKEALAIQAKSAFLVLFTGTQPMEMSKREQDYLLSLSRTLRAIGVELLDCAMVGEAGMVSMSVQGRMAQIAAESDQLELHEHYRAGVATAKIPLNIL